MTKLTFQQKRLLVCARKIKHLNWQLSKTTKWQHQTKLLKEYDFYKSMQERIEVSL